VSDTDSSFPSITFPATFEGAAAIGGDFSATLKMKTGDGPKVLADLKNLPRGTYDVTIVSRQGALSGDSVDREWAEMTLLDGDASELVYERTCIGARCPVFATHSSGEFEGRYVCENAADMETFMEVVHGETRCPRFAAGDVDDADVASSVSQKAGADAVAAYNLTATVSASPAKEQTSEEFLAACDARAQKNAPVVDPITGEVASTAARPLTPRGIIEHFEGPQEKCLACDGDGRIPDKTGGGHHRCKACSGRGEVKASTVVPVQTPDTLTVKELAEEFGALVIAAGDVDDMNEADTSRYNVLSDELTARGRNPHDWQRIAEDDAA